MSKLPLFWAPHIDHNQVYVWQTTEVPCSIASCPQWTLNTCFLQVRVCFKADSGPFKWLKYSSLIQLWIICAAKSLWAIVRTGTLPTPSSHTKGLRRMRVALGDEALQYSSNLPLPPLQPHPNQGRAKKKPSTVLHKKWGSLPQGGEEEREESGREEEMNLANLGNSS